ncbi:MAG: Lrp/AsnC family transcriptional regulator [Oscillospiraceae bacterium]|nr:Lrp/AsnC family transcriptional regulator [Oscillospiraceae bacterium]
MQNNSNISKEILEKLEQDCRISPKNLALMLDKEEGEIKDIIEDLEKERIILGYTAVIDWDKTDKEYVTALIELKVVPQRDGGFDKIAGQIYNYDEVQTVYLMSGGFDIAVILESRTMREVAYFVAEKIAVMEGIVATATHFVLRKYKEKGVIYSEDARADTRINLC